MDEARRRCLSKKKKRNIFSRFFCETQCFKILPSPPHQLGARAAEAAVAETLLSSFFLLSILRSILVDESKNVDGDK